MPLSAAPSGSPVDPAALAIRQGGSVIWAPQDGPQTSLLACPGGDVFFGGSRGGGKTDGEIGDFGYHAMTYGQAARGVVFRTEGVQLEDFARRAREVYGPMGARFVGGARPMFHFANGATLKLRHLKDTKAAGGYQGHAYSRIYAEELTEWPSSEALDKVCATLRSPEGVPVGFRASGNPGGVGHQWVKARYIDPAPGGWVPILNPATGEYRIFIPSKLEDNPALTRNDPTYERRLMASGPPELVKAWRWGIWDIAAGGYFSDLWNPRLHVLRPFPLPKSWTFRAGFDWGSANPAALVMAAISSGEPVPELGGRVFPRGSVIVFAELYTAARDASGVTIHPVKGQRLDNEELGRQVAQRLQGREWKGSSADPSIWTQAGGPSILEQMERGAATVDRANKVWRGLPFEKADHNRVAGWGRVRDLLREAAQERPEHAGLWIFDTCRDLLRTFPVLPSDPKQPDDVDSEVEDHAADALRYLVMGETPAVRFGKMRF